MRNTETNQLTNIYLRYKNKFDGNKITFVCTGIGWNTTSIFDSVRRYVPTFIYRHQNAQAFERQNIQYSFRIALNFVTKREFSSAIENYVSFERIVNSLST